MSPTPPKLPSALSPPPPPQSRHRKRPLAREDHREEAWRRRKGRNRVSHPDCRIVTAEDLDELRACIELGFGFDSGSPELDQKLSDTFPALGLYNAVNNYKQYYSTVSKLPLSSSPTSAVSNCDAPPPPPPTGCSYKLLDAGDHPEIVKARLRLWAQAVACSLRQSSV